MSAPGDGDLFDLSRLQSLVEFMKEHELGELELSEGERHVRLQRGGVAPLAAAPAAAIAAPAPAAGGSEPAAEPDNLVLIRSTMVGTYYSKPNPDAAPYVKVGDHIDADTTVCIVEAMKNFIPMPAGIRGEIVSILVEDGDAVDHDKPLFKVDTSK